MLLTRPKRWTEKPGGPVLPNPALPAGTFGLWLFNHGINMFNNAAAAFAQTTGTVNPTVTARGIARAHGNTDARGNLMEDSTVLPTTQITVAFAQDRATANNLATFGVASATANTFCGAFVPFGDGKVYWDFGGTTEDATRESVTVTATGYHTWAFTTGPRGMEIWQDGLLISSNAASPTRTATGVAWQLGRHGGQGSATANYYWFFAHRTQLAPALVREILLDPYNTICAPQAPRRALFTIGPAAGGGATGAGPLISTTRLAHTLLGRLARGA